MLYTSVVQVYMRDFKILLALTNCAGPPFRIFLIAQCHARGISGVWYGLRKGEVGCGVAAKHLWAFFEKANHSTVSARLNGALGSMLSQLQVALHQKLSSESLNVLYLILL